MSKDLYCYINGQIKPQSKAGVHLNDIGLLRGYSVFDFLKAYGDKPFLLQEHLNRLINSTKLVGLKLPISKTELTKQIHLLIKRNKLKESNIKIVVTGGESPNGFTYTGCPTLFILMEEAVPFPTHIYKKGVKLITCEYQRDNAQAKTTNYMKALQMQEEREKKKAFEILYYSKGNILECNSANFFIIKNKKLITPKGNILYGTTRNFILNLVKNDFKIIEQPIKIREIQSADETFITASNKEIVPVVQIDDIVIGDGTVGPITHVLMNDFQTAISKFKESTP